ncbi:MAG: peptide chain release factor N(5)-glutamine methyltransferase [Intrasporangium sp.]|uniref:peptide chain release factor N(5)-glutamine methyltransferase n=1 Tax=Intrasporangium sp. TaxID=1925024 RepID=UPI0026486ECB|nr:peptide chain release factor N(5)-glutamine methyltransferase [Intrasporangium sp.]MDN5796163.1 peptide chain release factor N(5)-glutamine methyltransferase [Intrasporangium sp.]
MTGLRTLVRAGAHTLAQAGIASADVDALALAAHVLRVETSEVRRRMVLGGDLPTGFEDAYAAQLAERARRVPLQHLTGRAHFRRITLAVGPGVFVPRPETEVLVGLALAEIDRLTGLGREVGEGGGGIRLVDLCAGSGAIAFAVKDERPDTAVRALELSDEALAWARHNRALLDLDVELVQGDATLPCFADWAGTVDVVTVNPPYIPADATPIEVEVRDHDPGLALYGGGGDGLAIAVRIAGVAASMLRPGGLLLMEHAESQGGSLPAALTSAGAWTEVGDHLDLCARPRVTSARTASRGRLMDAD